MSIYTAIQEVLEQLRAGNRDFKSLQKILEDAGADRETADKLIDKLLAQVEEG